MPSAFQLDRIDVVLVAPRNPLNIGAAARAMANFGFSHLTVVAPYEPHWREAQSAVGAEDQLRNARVCTTLKEALSGATFVLGTGTLTYRAPEQPVITLPDLAPLVRQQMARPGRIALVFGPEKHGLTRDDLALCHRLIVIPTSTAQPSMNLGQAVAVCLYELASRLCESASTAEPRPPAPSHLKTGQIQPPSQSERNKESTTSLPPATSATLDRLAHLIAETMQAAGYSPAAMSAANRHDLDLLLRRLHLHAPDATRILGLFRRILWRLRH